MPRSRPLRARRVLGAAGAAALAALAGVGLAQQSALESGSHTVLLPALTVSRSAPGRSGTRGPSPGPVLAAVAATPTPDAAPPPSDRAARLETLRRARVERATAIQRLARVLGGFTTDLDAEGDRALAATVHDESRRWGIDPFLTLAIIETESTYRNGAISFAGARGLMQIRPFVGEELAARLRLEWTGHDTLHDPIANVTLGVYYLAQLRARFGDLTLALAAYNIGPNAVQGLLDGEREVPTGYVRKVLASYTRLLAQAAPGGGTRAAVTARTATPLMATARR